MRISSRNRKARRAKQLESKDVTWEVHQTDRKSSGRATMAVGKGWHFEKRSRNIDSGSSIAGNQNQFDQGKDRKDPARMQM